MDQQRATPITVNILSKEYTVACPRGEEAALLASARRVDEEMRRIRDSGKVLAMDRIAVMVALNLAHELLLSATTAEPGSQRLVELPDQAQLVSRLQLLQGKLEASLERFS